MPSAIAKDLMDGRSRRRAVALSTVLALAVGAALVAVPVSNLPGDTATAPGSASGAGPASEGTPANPQRDSTAREVPGRYLVQAATPDSLARLITAVTRSGATVERTFDTTWMGVAVSASEEQLRRISSDASVSETFPVYSLSLNEPNASAALPSSAGQDEGSIVVPASGSTDPASSPGALSTVAAPTAANSGSTAPATGSTMEEPSIDAETTAYDDAFSAEYLTPSTYDVMANDTPGSGTQLLPESVVLSDASAQLSGKRLELPGRGTFTVTADGRIGFISVYGWSGTLDPVRYAVSDTAGDTASASIVVRVDPPAGPTSADDFAEGTSGHAIELNVLGNDLAHGAARLQPDALCLVDGAGCEPSLTTSDGTWVASDGKVTFQAEDGFVGESAVTYRVADELGQAADAKATVTVYAAPTAVDLSAATAYMTAVIVPVLAAPTPGGAIADPTSLALVSPDGSRATSVEVAGQGTYAVTADGDISFVPQRGFVGGSQVQFEYRDIVGALTGARLRVDVAPPPGPIAGDDSLRAVAGTTVRADVLANDSPGGQAQLDPESVCLVIGSACVAAVPDDAGDWRVDSSGHIEFTPRADLVGVGSMSYQVADEVGQSDTAVLTVSVSSPPVARDDKAHTAHRTPVEVDVLANDSPGSDGAGLGILTPSSVKLVDGETALRTAEGLYTANPATGAITFVPDDSFSGTAHTSYQVTDSFGGEATAQLTIRVGAAPAAVSDSATTPQGVEVRIPILDNDRPGDDGGDPGRPVPLDPTSVTLSAPSANGQTVETSVGTWIVDEAGTVSFTPRRTYIGTASIDYNVDDANGNATGARIEVTVTAVMPRGVADVQGVPALHSVDIDVLANDLSGDPAVPLDSSTLRLTADGALDDGTALQTKAGSWTVRSGRILFSPADDFVGRTTTTGYRVRDTNGTSVTATVSVRVGELTSAQPYFASTTQNVTTTLTPLAVVSVGDDGYGKPGRIVPDSMTFLGPGALQGGRVLIVQHEGTWRIDRDTGTVTFDPESTFSGVARAVQTVADSFGNTVTQQISLTVRPVVPALSADAAHTPANHALTVDVLANDREGDTSAPLNEASLAIVTADTSRGRWGVTADNMVSFTPVPGATGTAVAQYRVLDTNNTAAVATISVAVGAPPNAIADTASTPQDGKTLEIDPLANDTPGDDGAGAGRGFAPGSLILSDPASVNGGKTLVENNITWQVDGSNRISFTADWRFVGTASTRYRVTDAFANSTTASITVQVTATAQTSTEKRLTTIGVVPTPDAGRGVRVGVIDSGVDFTHPDLGGTTSSSFPTARVARGWDFVDGDGVPADCYGHGTHVAGIVAANGNPKTGGAFGVAPGVTLGVYRVFDCNGDATTEDILAAMDRAYADGMNIINLSLGASSASWPGGGSYPLTQAAATLVRKGIVVVAAAGNVTRGPFTVGSPAVAPGVISVAATNAAATEIEAYSATGPAADLSLSPTLSAPGTGVYSIWPGDEHREAAGTSMAAPEVAGAVAQILQAKGWTTRTPGLPARVAALLYASATPILSSDPGNPSRLDAVVRQGAGVVNVQKALSATVTASPASLRLGEGTSHSVTMSLNNTGSRSVTYRVSAASGLSLAPSSGSRMNTGNDTPDRAFGEVGFTAPRTVTVEANSTTKVTVRITAPAKVLKGRQGLLYGGWVRFSATDSPTVSVPFLGVRGDYQKVRLLPNSDRTFVDAASGLAYSVRLPALGYRVSGAVRPTYKGVRTYHLNRADGLPYVMFHLDYPASAIRVKATNQKTRKSYYAVLSGTSTRLGPTGRDEGLTLIPFYGVYTTARGTLARVPAGTYKLQLRALKPMGNASRSSHWETYTTRAFRLRWK